MAKKIDMKGNTYGKLLCIGESGRTADGHITWLFRCECGNEKVISGNDVRTGKTVSCGCVHKKMMKGNQYGIGNRSRGKKKLELA